MTWIKIDDQFAEHPKFVARSDAAIACWVRALAYSSRYLTDGQIPKAAQRLVGGDQAIDELVCAGILLDGGDHWQIHDYTDHQRTRAEVEADRERNAQRSRDYRSRKRHGVTDPARHGARDVRATDPDTDTDTDHHQALSTTQPVDNPADEKIGAVIQHLADHRTTLASPRHPSAYRAKVVSTLRDDGAEAQAATLINQYPQAPVSVIAAAIEGDGRNLHLYRPPED